MGLRRDAALKSARSNPAWTPTIRQLAAQPVRLALQPAGLSGKGTSISSSTCWARERRSGQGLGQEGRQKPLKSPGTLRPPKGKLDLLVTLDFSACRPLRSIRHRAADRDLVRKNGSQHQRHASLHPPAHPRRWIPPGRKQSDWEIFKGIAKAFLEVCARGAGRGEGRGAEPDRSTTAPAELAQAAST